MSRRLILRAGLRAAGAAGVALAVSAPVCAPGSAFAAKGSSCAETCVPSTLVQKAGCADTACTSGSSCSATAIPNCTTSTRATSTGTTVGWKNIAPAGHPLAPAGANRPTGLLQFVAQPAAAASEEAPFNEAPFEETAAEEAPFEEAAAEETVATNEPADEPMTEPLIPPTAPPAIEPAAEPSGPQTAEFSMEEFNTEEFSTGEPVEQSAIEPVSGFTLPTKADEAATRVHQIASRQGTGFRGFCPVVLRDRRELADAQTAVFSVYESRTYRFSSAEAKALFDADPAKYAPIRGGVDVVLLTEEGTEEEGSLAHAHWFRDRLFFFTSENTAIRFFNDPTKYVAE